FEKFLFSRKNWHVAGLVLARGGSKGIPLKNLAKIQNETLLGRTLETLTRFGQFNSIWVSTDDHQIARETRRKNVNVHWRESYTSTDQASSVLAVKEFIEKHPRIDVVALVQCTSPFLKVKYLERAYNMIISGQYESVFSLTRQHMLRWKLKLDGNLESDNFDINYRPRRQDWNGELVENGMFYFSHSNLITRLGLLQGGKLGYVEIPAKDSLEIDTELDLMLARFISNIKEVQSG
ncbi:hypothetical protein AAG570_009341, partial [Ranatra chinensis]